MMTVQGVLKINRFLFLKLLPNKTFKQVAILKVEFIIFNCVSKPKYSHAVRRNKDLFWSFNILPVQVSFIHFRFTHIMTSDFVLINTNKKYLIKK